MPNASDALFEGAVRFARRLWRAFWDQYEPDKRVADGIVERLVAGGEEERIILEGIEALVRSSPRDPWVYDHLVDAAAILLRENWLIMPDSLRLFAADVLAGTLRRPKRRGPREGDERRLRDSILSITVGEVAKRFSVAAYSAGEMKGPTAASIVAEALRREGEEISIAMITRAYKKRRDAKI